MTGKKKVIGLSSIALLVALGVSVVALSGAQAEETNKPHFTSFNKGAGKHEKTTYSGTSEATGGTTTFLSGGRTVECAHAEMEATSATGLDESLKLENIKYFGVKGNTKEPTCETPANHVVDVEMNGCTYGLNLQTTTTATVDINCAAGKEIVMKMTNPAKLGEVKCTLKVFPQTGLSHVVFSSASATELTAQFELSGVSYELEGDPVSCAGKVGQKLKDGKVEGKVIFTGTGGGGAKMELSIANVATK